MKRLQVLWNNANTNNTKWMKTMKTKIVHLFELFRSFYNWISTNIFTDDFSTLNGDPWCSFTAYRLTFCECCVTSHQRRGCCYYGHCLFHMKRIQNLDYLIFFCINLHGTVPDTTPAAAKQAVTRAPQPYQRII